MHSLFHISIHRFYCYRYAFVVHRTYHDALRNLERFHNSHPFGSQCYVEFTKDKSNQTNDINKKIMVSRIPLNVNRNDLHNLFGNCHIIDYCPARFIQSTIEIQTKILWG